MRRALLCACLWTACLAGCGGEGTRSLTPPDGKPAKAPRMSPDGLSIAYVLDGATDQVMVVSLDGASSRMLKEAPAITSVAWSPDGAKVYYASSEGIGWVPSAGGAATVVTATTTAARIDVSADGSALVFDNQAASSPLFALDLTRAGLPPLELSVRGSAPRFSRDGKRVAFIKSNATATLAVLDLTTRAVTDLLDTAAANPALAWSSDSAFIAYVSGRGIETMVVASRSHHQVAGEPRATHLDLHANGTILYVVDGRPDIYLF